MTRTAFGLRPPKQVAPSPAATALTGGTQDKWKAIPVDRPLIWVSRATLTFAGTFVVATGVGISAMRSIGYLVEVAL